MTEVKKTQPTNITYFVAVPFERDEEGNLYPGEPRECMSGDKARTVAQRLAEKRAGAVAFSRSGDLTRGDFADPCIIARFGATDLSTLCA